MNKSRMLVASLNHRIRYGGCKHTFRVRPRKSFGNGYLSPIDAAAHWVHYRRDYRGCKTAAAAIDPAW